MLLRNDIVQHSEGSHGRIHHGVKLQVLRLFIVSTRCFDSLTESAMISIPKLCQFCHPSLHIYNQFGLHILYRPTQLGHYRLPRGVSRDRRIIYQCLKRRKWGGKRERRETKPSTYLTKLHTPSDLWPTQFIQVHAWGKNVFQGREILYVR